MTTVRSQAAASRTAFLVAAMMLGGCVGSSTTYHFEGAQGEFCVPSAVDATPTPAGVGKVVEGGFAIRGCWNPGTNACQGPVSLISMTVGNRSDFVGRHLADFSIDAYIREVAATEAPRARPLTNRLLAIPDAMQSDTWYVWRMDGMPHAAVSENDELMAICKGLRGNRGYSCNRDILEPDYALSYAYFASGDLPASFKALDKRIISEVEALRCEKKT